MNNKINDFNFVSPTTGCITVSEIVNEIAEFIHKRPEINYRLVIGTDSQTKRVNGEDKVDFVTVIVIYGEGIGGRYFWKKIKMDNVSSLRQKIHYETWLSLEVAQNLVPIVRETISAAKYDFEIHIDVGSLGKTRTMISEVVGMVTANGFRAKIKPDSWGASSVADNHT